VEPTDDPVYAKQTEWRGYRGSVLDIVYQCRSVEELEELDRVLIRAVMAGKLRPRRRTLRKWRKAAQQRVEAMRKAALYGPDGNPIV
jgi:hypothetical protein